VNDSAVISPAKPADRDLALVTSSGSTTMASDTEPNTSGAAGATASQNRAVRTAAGGQVRVTRTGTGTAGVRHSTAAATVPITRCGRYGTTSGSGAHWASTAATTGPSPKPAVNARADRRALSPSPADSSWTHAVADPKTTPEHSPLRARPTVITASDRGPRTSSNVATGESTTNGKTTGRRPNRSETGPPMSSPGINVSA
jgi:hypothetical protein